MKQTIKLTESELREMIVNAINESMEEGENEGFLKNMMSGLNAGVNGKIDYHKNPDGKDAADQIRNNVGQRFSNFKKGYNMQKQNSKMDNLKQELKQLVNDGSIKPNQTVQELLANFGGLSRVKANNQRQAAKMGMTRKLSETIDRVIDEFLNEENKNEA